MRLCLGKMKGRKSGVNERCRGRAKEGVYLLVKERLERDVKDWREVLSRLMWMSLGCERWVFVAAYFDYFLRLLTFFLK